MAKLCDEPHCRQIIPDHLWTSHQDQHFVERLVAEDLEQNNQDEVDQALARALADESNSDSFQNQSEDADYQFALALNREFRIEEEQNSFHAVQKREWEIESQEEEERNRKILKLDEPRLRPSNQLILSPDLTPIRNQVLSNQTPDLIQGLRRALESSPSSRLSVLCHPGTSFFRFGFTTWGWACGYLNAQILLSSLKELMPHEYRKSFGNEIPSIRTLQTLIESGWAKGIDRTGAEQLRQSLKDTRKWIGTTEIYTLLTSARFRCLVHDFDFEKPPYMYSLVKYVEEYFRCSRPTDYDSASSCRVSDRPPLYFQHAGHSRTIVGIEYLKSKEINLLLFDPGRKPSSTIKDYANGKIGKKKGLSDDALEQFRVHVDNLAKRKEYQILRLQEGMMDAIEEEDRKEVQFIKMN